MDGEVFPSNVKEAQKIKKEVTVNGARLLLIRQKHLGSDKLPKYIEAFTEYLSKNGVDILENTDITDIEKEDKNYKLISKNKEFLAKKVIVAPGRIGGTTNSR